MHVVSGRESCLPRVVKEAAVSPRPWRRISTFVSWGDKAGGGVMVSSIVEGKSATTGRRVGMMAYINTPLLIEQNFDVD